MMDQLAVVVVAMKVVASVSDPGGTSSCHSVIDCTSHLSGPLVSKLPVSQL